MDKEFVPYEIALELKELGFDEYCMGAYYYEWKNRGTTYVVLHTPDDENSYEELCKAPLYQQAFRWFREKYGFDSWIEEINHGINNTNKQYIFQLPTITSHLEKVNFFDTYEEAELACLKKLIEIVKK